MVLMFCQIFFSSPFDAMDVVFGSSETRDKLGQFTMINLYNHRGSLACHWRQIPVMEKRFGARCRCQGQSRPEVTSTVEGITMSKPQRREVQQKNMITYTSCTSLLASI